MATERRLDANDVYVYVGDKVQLSDDATNALQNLAEALSSDGGDVSGFMIEDLEPEGIMIMIMVMLPDVRVTTGPISVVTGGCAVDVSFPSPIGIE